MAPHWQPQVQAFHLHYLNVSSANFPFWDIRSVQSAMGPWSQVSAPMFPVFSRLESRRRNSPAANLHDDRLKFWILFPLASSRPSTRRALYMQNTVQSTPYPGKLNTAADILPPAPSTCQDRQCCHRFPHPSPCVANGRSAIGRSVHGDTHGGLRDPTRGSRIPYSASG